MTTAPPAPPILTRGLFVTGTDTEVGKTHLVVEAVRTLRNCGYSVGAYKPACSGASTAPDGSRSWDDIERLHGALGDTWPRERIGPQCFDAPLAPPVAAVREGRTVDPELLRSGLAWWIGRVDVLLVEGVGGLLCPLTAEEDVADFAVAVGFPLLVVARAGLGTINHTLLTVEAARRRGATVAAVVLNRTSADADLPDETIRSNAEQIGQRGDVLVLGPLPWNDSRQVWERLPGPAPG